MGDEVKGGGRRPAAYACGTAKEACSGSTIQTNAGLRGVQAHSSTEAAFNCHKNWLLKQGFTMIDSRAFAPPDGGPVRVLTKKSRFGARLRNGKGGTRNNAPNKFGPKGGMISSL